MSLRSLVAAEKTATKINNLYFSRIFVYFEVSPGHRRAAAAPPPRPRPSAMKGEGRGGTIIITTVL